MIALTLKYQGSHYNGYQKQPGRDTVQSLLESSLKKVYQKEIKTVAAGRTDSGVHAEGQVVHYQSGINIPLAKLPQVINQHLPEDIRVYRAEEKETGFHARYSAKARQYRYRLWTGSSLDIPLQQLPFVHAVENITALELKRYLSPLIGYHDFTSFCHIDDPSPSKVREIFDLQYHHQGPLLEIDIFGNAFLRNMIRAIIGSALFALHKQKPENYLKDILLARDPARAKARAPAKGLCLYRVFYHTIYGDRDYYQR